MRSVETRSAQDRSNVAELLADLAEITTRKLYAPAGYSSMYAFCVGKLRMSEDDAFRRIRAARAALRFPVIFGAIADGRLHVTGVFLLSKHLKGLTEDKARELLTVAMGKSKSRIEKLIAERFPKPDMPTMVVAIPTRSAPAPLPVRVDQSTSNGSPAPVRVEAPTSPALV